MALFQTRKVFELGHVAHVNAPITNVLPNPTGAFRSLNCFVHVIYEPQISTYPNIIKHLTLLVTILKIKSRMFYYFTFVAINFNFNSEYYCPHSLIFLYFCHRITQGQIAYNLNKW